MKLTLKRIAELAGVSQSTASRVLNGHPGVRVEVRERLLQIMHAQGYQPDPAARSLAARKGRPHAPEPNEGDPTDKDTGST